MDCRVKPGNDDTRRLPGCEQESSPPKGGLFVFGPCSKIARNRQPFRKTPRKHHEPTPDAALPCRPCRQFSAPETPLGCAGQKSQARDVRGRTAESGG